MTTVDEPAATGSLPGDPAPAHPADEKIPSGTRIVAGLFSAQAAFAMSTSVQVAVTSLIAVQLAGTEAIAGVPAALGLAGRAGFAYPLGWLMDRFGRRGALGLGYFLGGVGSAFAILAMATGSLWLFLVAMLAIGMGRASADQSRFVAAEVSPLERRARAIGIVVFAGTIGALGAPPLIAFTTSLAEANGWDPLAAAVGAASVMTVVAAFLVWALLVPEPLVISRMYNRLQARQEGREESATRGIQELFRLRPVQFALLCLIVGQAVMVMVMVVLPIHMTHYDHGLPAISLVLLAHTLGMFGLSAFTGTLIDRFGRYQVILAGAIMLAASSLLAPISPDVVPLAVLMFFIGLGWNYTFIAGSTLFQDQVRGNNRGRAQGVLEALSSTAAAGGSLLAGVIFSSADWFGVAMVGFATATLLAVLAIWAWIVTGRRRAATTTPS